MRPSLAWEQLAAAEGWHPRLCPVCQGNRVARHRDLDAPGGVRLENPCSGCHGYGRVWMMDESTPSCTYEDIRLRFAN